jgi:hypothetical protein
MSELRRCNWCGKDRKNFSGIEKMSIIGGRWSEMCTFCERKHDRFVLSNPLAYIVGGNTRRVGKLWERGND